MQEKYQKLNPVSKWFFKTTNFINQSSEQVRLEVEDEKSKIQFKGQERIYTIEDNDSLQYYSAGLFNKAWVIIKFGEAPSEFKLRVLLRQGRRYVLTSARECIDITYNPRFVLR